MTITAYFVGQKYFPVIYDLRRILSYLFIALVLYFSEAMVTIDSIFIKLTYNTFLFVIFFYCIWKKEQADLRGLFGFRTGKEA